MHINSEGFFQRVLYPAHAWLYFFLRGPSWAIYFNSLPIKQKTSSRPMKDIFTPSLLCFLAGPKQRWMRAGDTHTHARCACVQFKTVSLLLHHFSLNFILERPSFPFSTP